MIDKSAWWMRKTSITHLDFVRSRQMVKKPKTVDLCSIALERRNLTTFPQKNARKNFGFDKKNL
jgi:hypothetical protein